MAPAGRLAAWRNFKRKFPSVPLPDDYYDALRIRESERQADQAERRLAELERRIEDAERTARAAEALPVISSSVSYPTLAAPVYVANHYPRRRSVVIHKTTGHGDRHDGHRAHKTTARFRPYHSTPGYAYQRSHAELSKGANVSCNRVGARTTATVGTNLRPSVRPVTRIGH
jgi:hypothetical protein